MKKILLVLALCLVSVNVYATEAEKPKAEVSASNILNLTIYDRMTLQSIMPQNESFEKAIIIRSLLTKIEITPEEIEKYEIKTQVNEITGKSSIGWNDSEYAINLTLSTIEIKILKDAIQTMDRKKQIPVKDDRFFTLYDKIQALK